MYRAEINYLQIQLSRIQAGPGRAVKEQQEQYSPNHMQKINLIFVVGSYFEWIFGKLEVFLTISKHLCLLPPLSTDY